MKRAKELVFLLGLGLVVGVLATNTLSSYIGVLLFIGGLFLVIAYSFSKLRELLKKK